MIVWRYCLSPHEVKCSHIKYDVFQLTTYRTSIHLVVKRYQAKWRSIYFYVRRLFLVVILVRRYCLFLRVTGMWSCYLKFPATVVIKKASRLFLKTGTAFCVVPCFRRSVVLLRGAALPRSGLSERESWWWPQGANVGETSRATSLWAQRAGSPTPGGQLLARGDWSRGTSASQGGQDFASQIN